MKHSDLHFFEYKGATYRVESRFAIFNKRELVKITHRKNGKRATVPLYTSDCEVYNFIARVLKFLNDDYILQLQR